MSRIVLMHHNLIIHLMEKISVVSSLGRAIMNKAAVNIYKHRSILRLFSGKAKRGGLISQHSTFMMIYEKDMERQSARWSQKEEE